MFRNWMAAACVIACTIGVPAAVSAQSSRPEPASVRRPYRGIFGSPSDPDSPQSLVFTASVYEAYDDNVITGLTGHVVRDPFLQQSGFYQGAEAGLNYDVAKTGDRFSIGAHTGGEVRYVHRPGDGATLPYFHSDVDASWRITRSTTLSARQSVAYATRYNSALTPLADETIGHDIAVMPDPDLDLFALRALRSTSSIVLRQQIGWKTSVSGGYALRTLDVFGNDVPGSQFSGYRTHAGWVGIDHSNRLTPHAELVMGYSVRVSDRHSHLGEPRVMQNINAGVNYSRALSFSRRTELSFGSGSYILTRDNFDNPDGGPNTKFHAIGNASLAHEMGRTWTARASYARGVRTRDGFGELYFIDGVTVSLDGLVTRRLSWVSTARWATSTIDRVGQNGHRAAAASAQATYALNSLLGLYARYVYYKYGYGEDVPLDPRMPGRLDRQGVRVGLTTSIALIR